MTTLTLLRRLILLGLAVGLAWAALGGLGLAADSAEGELTAGAAQVSLSGTHACALSADGEIICWGAQLPWLSSGMQDGGAADDFGRVRYAADVYTHLATGADGGCGQRADGSVFCWGGLEDHNGTAWRTPTRTFTDAQTLTFAEYLDDPARTAGWSGYVQAPGADAAFQPGSVTGAFHHYCGLLATGGADDGAAACWGETYGGELLPPTEHGAAITDWQQLAVGFGATCGIRADGRVQCWGSDYSKLVSQAPTDQVYVDLALSLYFGCAVAQSGGITCWGDWGSSWGSARAKRVPSGINFVDVEMQQSTLSSYPWACGLGQAGMLTCWGIDGGRYRVFRGDHPKAPPAGPFADFSLNGEVGCARTAGGELQCWGESQWSPGSLVDGAPAAAVHQLGGGVLRACALDGEREVVCWGDAAGRYGFDEDTPAGPFAQLSTGFDHNCAVRAADHPDGAHTAVCWSDRWYDTSTLPAGQQFHQLEAGSFDGSGGRQVRFVCGILRDDGDAAVDRTAECWNVGDASIPNRYLGDVLTVPTAADGTALHFTDITAALTHACGLTTAQSIVCWGTDKQFTDADGDVIDPLGFGRAGTLNVPTGTHQYTEIEAGDYTTCALRDDERAVCWGYTLDGSLAVPGWADDPDGQGFGTSRYRAIAAGPTAHCGIGAIDYNKGKVECWNDARAWSQAPAEIQQLQGLKEIAGGTHHMCVTDHRGKLYCWGFNSILMIPAYLQPSVEVEAAEEPAADDDGQGGAAAVSYGAVAGFDALEVFNPQGNIASSSRAGGGASPPLPFKMREDAECLEAGAKDCGSVTASSQWARALDGAVPQAQLAARRGLYMSTAIWDEGSQLNSFRSLPGGRKGLAHDGRRYEAVGQAVELNLWLIYARAGSGLNSVSRVGTLSAPLQVCLPRPAGWQEGSVWAVWDRAAETWRVVEETPGMYAHQICVLTEQLDRFQQLNPFRWSESSGADV